MKGTDMPENVPTPQGYQNEGSAFWGPINYEDAPQLVWPLNIAVYDKMRRTDPQVMAVIRAVTLPVRRTGWRISAGDAREEVARFVADDLGLTVQGDESHRPLRTRDRFDFGEHLRLALLKLVFGHSFFEQVYTVDAAANRAHLSKLLWLPPRTIERVDVASDGGLNGVQQYGQIGTRTPTDLIPVKQLVAYVQDREGGNWLGQSILRPAYKFWLLKDQMIRKAFETYDRNGMGIPTFTARDYEYITDEDERKRLEAQSVAKGVKLAAGFRSGANAGASLSHGETLDLVSIEGTLPDADPQIRYYDQQIAQSVLANFLTLGGDNSTGSYALGSTFVDFFVLSLQTVADEVEAIINQHVIEDLVDLNFGPMEPAPRLVHEEIGSRTPVTAEGIRALVECGAITPDDGTESFLRTTFGMPEHDATTARPFQPTQTTTTTTAGGTRVPPAPTGE